MPNEREADWPRMRGSNVPALPAATPDRRMYVTRAITAREEEGENKFTGRECVSLRARLTGDVEVGAVEVLARGFPALGDAGRLVPDDAATPRPVSPRKEDKSDLVDDVRIRDVEAVFQVLDGQEAEKVAVDVGLPRGEGLFAELDADLGGSVVHAHGGSELVHHGDASDGGRAAVHGMVESDGGRTAWTAAAGRGPGRLRMCASDPLYVVGWWWLLGAVGAWCGVGGEVGVGGCDLSASAAAAIGRLEVLLLLLLRVVGVWVRLEGGGRGGESLVVVAVAGGGGGGKGVGVRGRGLAGDLAGRVLRAWMLQRRRTAHPRKPSRRRRRCVAVHRSQGLTAQRAGHRARREGQ